MYLAFLGAFWESACSASSSRFRRSPTAEEPPCSPLEVASLEEVVGPSESSVSSSAYLQASAGFH